MTLFWISLSWILGLLLSPVLGLTDSQWSLVTGVSLLGLLLGLRRAAHRLLFALIVVFCLSSIRLRQFNSSLSAGSLAEHNDLGRSLSLRGRVVSFPEERDSTMRFVLEAQSLRVGEGPWTSAEGRALVHSSPWREWRYGDKVELQGRLESPPEFEGFSYRAYLERLGVHSLLYASDGTWLAADQANPALGLIFRIREFLHSRLERLFPEPEASLLAGILLGLEGGISPELRAAFDRTGTTHIIAISGFNISIVAAIFIRILGRWLGARRGAAAAALGITLYTVLVGAQAAVVRAALMAGMALLAKQVGRSADGHASLGGAALVMTAIDPNVVRDIGFQLSFAATLGLLLYSEPLANAARTFLARSISLQADKIETMISPISEFVLMSLAAQIMTLPLVAFHFGRLSLIAPLANLLILPAQPGTMVLGGIAILAGSLWFPLGRLLAMPALLFPAYTIALVEFMAQLPLAQLSLQDFQLPHLIISYSIIVVLTLVPRIPSARDSPFSPPALSGTAALGSLGVLTVLVWKAVFLLPDGFLHITVLDVGAEPGVLIVTPSGRRLLIDGGASALSLGRALDQRLGPFNRSLDWVLLSGAEEERVAAIARLVERYRVGGVLLSGSSQSPAFAELATYMARIGRPIASVPVNGWMDLGGGARLHFLEDGRGSPAFWVQFDRFSFLLNPAAERGWLSGFPGKSRAPRATALLLPSSGEISLSPIEEIRRLQPQVIVIPTDAGELTAPLSPALSEGLEGYPVLRTDAHGWIELKTDSRRLWVEVERSPTSFASDGD